MAHRAVRVAVLVGAFAYALAVAFVVPRSGALITTYARASDVASALGLAAGLCLLAAGALAAIERSPLALPALAAGVVWFAPDWVGWEGGPPLARSLGLLVAPLLAALLLHLALPGRRRLVWAAYAITGVAAVGLALLRDPFEDEHCWSNCTDNVLLVHADQRAADALTALWHGSAIAIGLLVAVAAWRRAPALALAGLAEAAYAAALAGAGPENPARDGFAALFLVRAAALTLAAAGLAWQFTRGRRTRAAVARVGAEREAAARPLREVLARALGDPGLQVAYPLPSGRTVDERGRPLALTGPVTRIERDGRPIALVATGLDTAPLAREIGAAARLAVDNERLQAVVLAQLDDLRASRMRIVETGDAARQRLERDLHDGAQQRLLAVSYELRLAQAGARADGDAALAGALAAAGDEARLALDDLRELAHGIYPAVLAEAGLEAAVATLADTTPLPLVLGEIARERLAAPVETAAYLVVAAGVEDAARRGATYARVSAVRADSRLLVTVADDGGEPSPPRHLADRVGALGGRLDTRPGTLEAEIPCA